MQRYAGAQAHHDRMIRFLAARLTELEYRDIRADLDGFVRPDLIAGRKHEERPDLTCLDASGRLVIIEVETANTWDDQHVIGQWTLFRSAANYAGGEFHVAIPKDCGVEDGRVLVENTLDILEIKAEQIWELEV